MYYSIYKNLRNGTWQCLIYVKASSLPIDVLAIARAANIRVVKNSILNELSSGEAAKTYYDGDDWIIIYNDLYSSAIARFAIAHELGHIFLGHATTYTKYSNVREFGKKPRSEQQADMFALRLLTPACVLMGLQLQSAEDISNYCKIPLDKAKERSLRMKKLYTKNAFFTDELEAKLYNNFKVYINENKHEQE